LGSSRRGRAGHGCVAALRLVCHFGSHGYALYTKGAGDAEWPTHLNDLGDARPIVLWLRGTADLRLTCVNSVAVVGARAATGYGNHVAVEMAAVLAEHGLGVVCPAARRLRKPNRRSPSIDLRRRIGLAGAGDLLQWPGPG
jgi:hypothetical protein